MILFLISVSITLYKGVLDKPEKVETVVVNSNRKIIYPRQYSDTHITENAKISDQRFRSITFEAKTSLLANVVSVLKKNDSIPKTEDPENGSWLWTPILQITPTYRENILNSLKKNGVKNVYLSIDSYLDIYAMEEGEEKENKLKEFNDIVSSFVTSAKEKGMTVDLEAGWRNWAEMGNSYKAFVTLNYAVDFNKNHDNKVRGFQYDIEPYLLDEYKTEKKKVLGNFVNLVDEAVAKLDGSDLTLSVVIPEFYDGTLNETPKIYYAGKNLYTVEQLLRILDKREESKLIVMSYRNFSRGSDGSIDISKEEINTGNKYNTKIIIAQETGDVKPPYVTFYNTKKSYYNKQLGYVVGAFKNDQSFGGIANHYVNAFLDLK